MAKTLDTFVATLPTEEQEAIAKRTLEVATEYDSLQKFRKAMRLTQTQIGEQLGMDQGNLSRLEKQSDFMLSTLKRYVEAMNGRLRMVVEFDDHPPIELAHLLQDDKEDRV